ncbi:MAG: aspartate--tRNA ligase [Gemmatimonadaceae bacterium]
MTNALSLATTVRTHLGGELRSSDVGTRVKLGGWVQRQRAMGGIVFLDLRDRAGVVQVSFDPKFASDEAIRMAGSVGRESVVLIEGEVVARPDNGRNAELATGDVEVKAVSMRVVGPAETPAIPVTLGKGETLPSEELRLRHRYLDLRRPELQANIVLRHRLMQVTRRHLSERGFLEIETPILTKPTPEGARDYLVPSRVSAGEFYALPQSPQLYKQLLMISGFDRYFQIARCFRDEDLRADRQPEFTQIDIEASFISAEDIYTLAEGLMTALWKEGGVSIPTPFPRMRHADAVERYGSDRPDLRYGLELFDATDAFGSADFAITRSAIDGGGRVRGMRIPGGAVLSRKQVDDLEALARGAGAAGMLRLKREKGELTGPPVKFLSPEQSAMLGIEEGELCLLVAAPDRISSPALDRVRQEAARVMKLIPEKTLSFLWVLDFPLFEKDPATGALGAVHHPFTSPHPDDIALLDTAPEKARAVAYDVVLNGTELGGGSIRIADPDVQRRMFNLLAIDDEMAQQRFGFLLEGLRSGAPPHGGIAFGFDRIAMLLSGAASLRDVIAFPKTTAARALFEGARTPVAAADLRELHIRLDEGDATR